MFKLRKARWKNYALWVAIGSLFVKVLIDTGVQVAPEEIEAYIEMILLVAVLAGIINDPNEGKGLSDDNDH